MGRPTRSARCGGREATPPARGGALRGGVLLPLTTSSLGASTLRGGSRCPRPSLAARTSNHHTEPSWRAARPPMSPSVRAATERLPQRQPLLPSEVYPVTDPRRLASTAGQDHGRARARTREALYARGWRREAPRPGPASALTAGVDRKARAPPRRTASREPRSPARSHRLRGQPRHAYQPRALQQICCRTFSRRACKQRDASET